MSLSSPIRPEEITSIIEQELNHYERHGKTENIGTVLQTGDGISRVYGLSGCQLGELLEFPRGVMGLAMNLEEDSIGAILLGNEELVKEGDPVRQTNQLINIPVGKGLLGRIISPLGDPIDNKGPISAQEHRLLESMAPGVFDRQPIKEPLQTGIKAIDSMIPIGKGQRELIIGDRQTGKTAICIDTILNQKKSHQEGNNPVYCIYVAIGQKMSSVARVVETLHQHGALEYTTVVVASSSDCNAIQYIAPFAGCAIGEYFRDNGMHALIVYDDLSKHAQAYRAISLLLRRPPGREAYPGDVFYLHSRLLERAGKISKAKGGGSLTALPIVETYAGDVSAYIPTNVISITDGQIYLEPDLFFAGIRPAINVGISVSRVGGNAQSKAMKTVAGTLKLEMAQFKEVQAFAQFASDLDKTTQQQLRRGQKLTQVLTQDNAQPYEVEDQIIIIFGGTHGYFDNLPNEKIKEFEKFVLQKIHTSHSEITHIICSTKEFPKNLEESLCNIYQECLKQFEKMIAHG